MAALDLLFLWNSKNFSTAMWTTRLITKLVQLCRSQWPRGLKTLFCGLSPAEIVGSNPAGGKDICLL